MALFDTFGFPSHHAPAEHARQGGPYFRTGPMGERVDDAGRRILHETWSVPGNHPPRHDVSSYTRQAAYSLDHPSGRREGQRPTKSPFWRMHRQAKQGSESSSEHEVDVWRHGRSKIMNSDRAEEEFDLYAALIAYEERWEELVGWESEGDWGFEDIPWPTWNPPSTLGELHSSTPNLRRFLLSSLDPELTMKDRIRASFLRWHPDKFFGRYLDKVRESDREPVKAGVYVVCRLLQELQEERSS